MSIDILNVRETDAQFLYELMNEESVLRALNEVRTELSDWKEAISEWNSDPDEEDYIIYYEGTPAGWFAVNGLASEDKKVYIKMIALLPQYQNMGIGYYTINHFLDILKLKGYTEAILYTNQKNCRAQKCYAKCGFTVTEEFNQKMSDGNFVKRYKMIALL